MAITSYMTSVPDYRKWPVVTAIVNTYERPDLLPRALDSVLAQDTDTPYEVIVIHDGPSSEATSDVIIAYEAKFSDKDIPYSAIALAENSGYQCAPKNIGIHQAQGDYIAFLDDDNEWTPGHIRVLLQALEEGTVWPDFSYGRRRYVCDSPDVRGPNGEHLVEGDSIYVPWGAESVERLAKGPSHNFIDTSDAMIAKGAFWRMFYETDKMWNEDMRRFGDWELFARGAAFCGWRGKAVDEVVQIYHWHGANLQITRPATETPEVRSLA